MFRKLLLNNVDIAICDFFTLACIDAAYEANVPFAVTVTGADIGVFDTPSYLPYTPGTIGATMEHATFWERFSNAVYEPIRTMIHLWGGLNYQQAILKQNGIELYTDFTGRYASGLVIIFTIEGFEPPRPLPPTMFYAGPLLNSVYDPLSSDLEKFIEKRSNIIYTGFGSITVLPDSHYKLLICAFSLAYEKGVIDGVIFGLMLTNTNNLSQSVHCSQTGYVNSHLLDSSNTKEHRLDDMLNGNHPFIRIMQRAPQRAVLEHPSVRGTISHCGLTSVHDAMITNTLVLCIPGFADQPWNALRLKHLGAGERLLWADATVDNIVDKLDQLLHGNNGLQAQLAMQRLNKMAVLASRRVPIAADMVEMAAIPGALQLLEPASERMAWWRANNADIWLFIVLVSSAIVMFLYYGCRRMFTTKQSNITPQAKHLSYKAHTE
ncbi:hypothetical protein BDF19DRAFT_180995 [Syncephalis fuscata]|nr:hypothetical protein BDF19DRAFT_180995 [Syncephalis fuscata]